MTFIFEGQPPPKQWSFGFQVYIYISLCRHPLCHRAFSLRCFVTNPWKLMSYPKSHGNGFALAQSRMLCNAYIQACDDFEAWCVDLPKGDLKSPKKSSYQPWEWHSVVINSDNAIQSEDKCELSKNKETRMLDPLCISWSVSCPTSWEQTNVGIALAWIEGKRSKSFKV